MSVHIYRSPGQSLIKEQRCPWIMRGFKLPAMKPNALVWAVCCRKRRPAKNCCVQHYYDGSYIWCLEGKGCKSEDLLKRKTKRGKQRRSIAAKRGWRTRRAAALSQTERRCQKCGCVTGGEEAWVDGQIWCHPCADAVPSTDVTRPNDKSNHSVLGDQK